MLRWGGRLLVTTPWHGRVVVATDAHFDPRADHLRFFSARTLRAVLADAGFASARRAPRRAAGCTPRVLVSFCSRLRRCAVLNASRGGMSGVAAPAPAEGVGAHCPMHPENEPNLDSSKRPTRRARPPLPRPSPALPPPRRAHPEPRGPAVVAVPRQAQLARALHVHRAPGSRGCPSSSAWRPAATGAGPYAHLDRDRNMAPLRRRADEAPDVERPAPAHLGGAARLAARRRRRRACARPARLQGALERRDIRQTGVDERELRERVHRRRCATRTYSACVEVRAPGGRSETPKRVGRLGLIAELRQVQRRPARPRGCP